MEPAPASPNQPQHHQTCPDTLPVCPGITKGARSTADSAHASLRILRARGGRKGHLGRHLHPTSFSFHHLDCVLTLLPYILTNTAALHPNSVVLESGKRNPALSLHGRRTTVHTEERHLLQDMSHRHGPFSLNAVPGTSAALTGATKPAKGFVDEGSAEGHHHVVGRKPLVPTGLRQLSGIQRELPARSARCQAVHQPKGCISERQKFCPNACCGSRTRHCSCEWLGLPQPGDLCWLLVPLQMAEGSPKGPLCEREAAKAPTPCTAGSSTADVPVAKHPRGYATLAHPPPWRELALQEMFGHEDGPLISGVNCKAST